MRSNPRTAWTVLSFALSFALACSGELTGGGSSRGAGPGGGVHGGPGGPGGPGASADGGSVGPVVPAASEGPTVPGVDRSATCDETAIPATLVRRLTPVEYLRTVRDLFPGIEIPEQDLVADLRVHGFENNATALNPSAVLIEQYGDAAARVAELVATAGPSFTPCTPATADMACASQFIEQFGLRAFRRPLSDDERARYEAFFSQQLTAISFNGALELTLAAFLQSPQFVYRLELGAPAADGATTVALGDYELASRLSYFLWQTMPDKELLDAAGAGELHTVEQVGVQVRRMLDDPRASVAFVDFHRQWLDFDRLMNENKDPVLFPDWNEDVKLAMREESDRFVAHIFEQEGGSVSALLTSTTSFVNDKLAVLYGVSSSATTELEQVELPSAERAGILTRGTFLASFAHTTNGSPPLRGVAVLDHLLCNRPMPPPPTADTSTPVSDGTPKTNRQLFEERNAPEGCQSCHKAINGIGYGFEAFDSIGKFRTVDNGLPVNASGELVNTDVDGTYDGAVELSQRLAESEQVRFCSVRNYFRYATGRDDLDTDWCKLDRLFAALEDNGGDVRELMVTLATSYEFMHRPVVAP